jgi:hypothetical protein
MWLEVIPEATMTSVHAGGPWDALISQLSRLVFESEVPDLGTKLDREIKE